MKPFNRLFLPLALVALSVACTKGGDDGPDPPPTPPPATKTVTVAAQSGSITAGQEGEATFAVTTENIADGLSLEITWFADAAGTGESAAPSGINVSANPVQKDKASVVFSAKEAATGGVFYFKATVDGTASGVATLTVADPEVPPGPLKVYVAGEEWHSEIGSLATLWTDGVPLRLNNSYSNAYALFVDDDGTVYVAGTIADKSVLWTVTDGNVTNTTDLTDGETYSFTDGVCKVGGTFHVCGMIQDHSTGLRQAILWIVTGSEVTTVVLSEASADEASAHGLYAAPDGTVYITGFSLWGTEQHGMLWTVKNGQVTLATRLASGTAGMHPIAYNLCAVEGTIYVCGEEGNDYLSSYPIVWTVDTSVTPFAVDYERLQPESELYAYASAVYADGASICVTGCEWGEHTQRTAVLWTLGGGKQVPEQDAHGDEPYSEVSDGCAVDGTVYLTGTNYRYASVWTDGELEEYALSADVTDSYAYAIAVSR